MALTEFQTKWLAALRSGDYEQGRNFLRTTDNRFCCLGVAYDVEGAEWEEDGREEDYREDAFVCADSGSNNFPSKVAMNRWGIRGVDACDLASMNDGTFHCHGGRSCWERHTFSEIADYLEGIL